MKFAVLAGKAAEYDILKTEYKRAERQGEIRLGETHLFYRYFIKVRYVCYEEINRAYLREESGESGEFLIREWYLMLEMRDGTLHKLRMEREGYARDVLRELEKEHRHITAGFDRLSQTIS